ncbi:efflux RND transporter periplasmic adaptor subunit [Rhodanobacter sp. AS-Z3]|uniref:efflux RND transporter periplasmic adaptor subunit n=1 Tax=Rhodanobacter sp. AS-Z3 TaxID=3031330 RepID=UPI00247938A8|nr:efflux RND transporter periplasmic adaptor subunit [Rhodanobacter sp. AS-Z3]WEN16021.1 efflux RND transporter periplasmic adaptor subunit [Rhodanobacter sp. AS-Z3]
MKSEISSVTALMRRTTPAVLSALALTSLLVLVGCSSKADSPAVAASDKPQNVTLTAAQREHIHLLTLARSRFHRSIETSGVVDFDHDRAVQVLAPFSGPVTEVLVNQGDQVKQGQPLARVDSPDFAAAAGAYRKALAAAQVADKLAATDRDLYAHQAISQREQAQAQSDAIGADADRDAALQALLALHVDQPTIAALRDGKPVAHGQGVIRAPIAGTVVEKSIAPGQLLAAGSTECFTVADTSKMWVMAQLFGDDAAAVKNGDQVTIDTEIGSAKIQGKVSNVGAVINPDTRSIAARVLVDNADGALKHQMYVRAHIQSSEAHEGLLVPVSAVLRDDDNLPFVYVAAADGGYAQRTVTLGERVDDQFLISEGLHVGDKVVVDGAIFLHFIQTQ